MEQGGSYVELKGGDLTDYEVQTILDLVMYLLRSPTENVIGKVAMLMD